MKKINATVTTTKKVIAEISISYEDKKTSGLSFWIIADKYMESDFPGIDDWKWEANRVWDESDEESGVTGHWLITIYREETTLIFGEKEQPTNKRSKHEGICFSQKWT